MIEVVDVSRRGFLGQVFSTGAFVLGAPLASSQLVAGQAAGAGSSDEWRPSVFLGIDPSGKVTIVASRSEMGTGCTTCVPVIVADELEADWSGVKVIQALGNPKYGSQNTDGSCSVKDFYETMRTVGASARTMLERAAAKAWNVPPENCRGQQNFVIETKTGRKMSYAELVPVARRETLPKAEEIRFKTPAEFRYIGKDLPVVDLHQLVTGQGVFGIDARMPGMVYAAVARPPVMGSELKSVDDKGAKRVKGVSAVMQIPMAKPPLVFQPLGGAAVIADNSWAAIQGRNALKVEWGPSPNDAYDSESYRKLLLDGARQPSRVAREMGNVDQVFAKGGKTHEASYYAPMLAHAPMEPPAAVAEFKDGKVVTWAATQNPQAVQETVAAAVGIPKEDVICHVTLLGSAFGRKSKPDYVAEAAMLSKQVGKPVKIVWSREDDVQFDYYHSPAGMHIKAAVDEKGLPIAWLQRSVFPPIGMLWNPQDEYGGSQLDMGWTDIPYSIPNLRVENGPAQAHIRIGWLRSVSNIYHAFAVQSFSDELAALAGRDRVEYLLQLIGPPRVINFGKEGQKPAPEEDPKLPFDTGRLRNVIEVAAQKSGWANKKPAAGRALGIAAHRSFYTYVAAVVEVEKTKDGGIRIPRVDIALDAGRLINPDRVAAQFEGAAVFGTSVAMLSEVTAKHGRVEQANFDGYEVARMDSAPFATHVHVVKSDAHPAGVGEPGVPPIAPAICNAIFAATGKRIRELPIKKHLG